MAKFNVTFEFTTHEGNTYWLPMILESPSSQEAEVMARKFETGLCEKFEVRRLGPVPNGGQLEEILRAHNDQYHTLRVEKLHVNQHRFTRIEGHPDLTVGQHFKMAEVAAGDDLPGDSELVARLRLLELPVRLVRAGDLESVQETLVINVLAP